MSYQKSNPPIGEAYAEQLRLTFGEQIADQLTTTLYAEAGPRPDDAVPYVRAGEATASPNPVFSVPGFSEGIVAKAPFAGAMAARGFDITLPGQNRAKLKREADKRIDVTGAQARNYLAVLEATGLPEGDTPIDVLPRSYGAPIFERMVKLKPDWFRDSRVIMMAAASNILKHRERVWRIGGRFVVHGVTENFARKEFHDVKGEMMKAGVATVTANIPRAWGEIRAIAGHQMDIRGLLFSGIQSLDMLTFGRDQLMPGRNQDKKALGALMLLSEEARSQDVPAAVFTNNSIDTFPGVSKLTHNGDQFNPSVVADAVAAILTAQR